MKLAMLVLVLTALSAAVLAADLPGLARRERARRDALAEKDKGGLSRSYDDADLERYRREGVSDTRSSRARVIPSGAEERDRPREEAFWRRELERHQRELDRIDAGIRRLDWRLREKRSRRRPGERLVEDPSMALIEETIQSLRDERSRIEKRFRERARKSRALPGWIR